MAAGGMFSCVSVRAEAPVGGGKAPDVDFFTLLPVGVNADKPARGSVSLIQAGFRVGLFFGRSILARKWLAKMTKTWQN